MADLLLQRSAKAQDARLLAVGKAATRESLTSIELADVLHACMQVEHTSEGAPTHPTSPIRQPVSAQLPSKSVEARMQSELEAELSRMVGLAPIKAALRALPTTLYGRGGCARRSALSTLRLTPTLPWTSQPGIWRGCAPRLELRAWDVRTGTVSLLVSQAWARRRWRGPSAAHPRPHPRPHPHPGKPGVGKTKVARFLGRVLHRLGAVPSNTFVEVQQRHDPSSLIRRTTTLTPHPSPSPSPSPGAAARSGGG